MTFRIQRRTPVAEKPINHGRNEIELEPLMTLICRSDFERRTKLALDWKKERGELALPLLTSNWFRKAIFDVNVKMNGSDFLRPLTPDMYQELSSSGEGWPEFFCN